MANFKAGDKVRIKDHPMIEPKEYRGKETTITGPSFSHWLAGTVWPVECYAEGASERVLEPLTPPAEDAWAADKVKELTRPKPMDVEREEVKHREREFDRLLGNR